MLLEKLLSGILEEKWGQLSGGGIVLGAVVRGSVVLIPLHGFQSQQLGVEIAVFDRRCFICNFLAISSLIPSNHLIE